MNSNRFSYANIIIPFLVLGSTIICHGQYTEKEQRKSAQTVYLNSKDSLIRFDVMEHSKSGNFDPKHTYYWYKSNSIFKTDGGGDGKLLNGGYTCFYRDDNLKEKGRFKNGLKDGTWTSWYENGKIKERTNWKLGIIDGDHIMYDVEGNIAVAEKYKHGTIQAAREKGLSTHKLKGRKLFEDSNLDDCQPKEKD